MKIEHWGYQVADPVATAKWYCEHLGFTIAKVYQNEAKMHFLADESGNVMIEIYCNPTVEVPDYAKQDPLLSHLAFSCDDIPGKVESLLAAGATIAIPLQRTDTGDTLAMLRDPWGMPIQLCDRAVSMI